MTRSTSDVLQQLTYSTETEYTRVVDAVGGLWFSPGYPAGEEIVAVARELGVRGLVVRGDASYVRELPDLEIVQADPIDVTPLHDLPRLRALDLSGWGGRLDGSAWPRLEWFGALETPRGGGGVESLFGHPSLRSLAVGRFRERDLTGITAPLLRSLAVGPAPRLESLRGIERYVDQLVHLEVSGAPCLGSLEGLDALRRLEKLELAGLRQVTDLEVVARLPMLRFLDVSGLRGVESLAPLAGHPTLEYVCFDRVADLDLDPLLEVPHLKAVGVDRRIRWNRDIDDLPHVATLDADDPRLAGWHSWRNA